MGAACCRPRTSSYDGIAEPYSEDAVVMAAFKASKAEAAGGGTRPRGVTAAVCAELRSALHPKLGLETLPVKIIQRIFHFLNRKDQLPMLRASRKMLGLSVPIIYREVDLSDWDAAETFAESHGLTFPASKTSVLQFTTRLQLGGMDADVMRRILSSCGRELLELVFDVPGLRESELSEALHVLPRVCDLQVLEASGINDNALYAVIRERRNITSLEIGSVFAATDYTAPACPDSDLPQGLVDLNAYQIRSTVAIDLIRRLVLLSAASIETIDMHQVGNWVPVPNPDEKHAQITFPKLTQLSVSPMSCEQLRAILVSAPHLSYLDCTISHSGHEDATAPACEGNLLATLPTSLHGLALANLTLASSSAESIRACVRRLDKLISVPVIRYSRERRDALVGHSQTVFDDSVPFAQAQKVILKELEARGLVLDSEEDEEDTFCVWDAAKS